MNFYYYLSKLKGNIRINCKKENSNNNSKNNKTYSV